MNLTAFSGKLTFALINSAHPFGVLKDLLQKRPGLFLKLSLIFISLFVVLASSGQKVRSSTYEDSLPAAKVDSLIKAQHSPRKAAIRSAIIPGWGQVYNKKYWKVPIVWAALGITAKIFVTNLHTYQDARFAYTAKYNASLPPYDPINNPTYPGPYRDSTDYFKMKPEYLPVDPEAIRVYRNQYRQYVDYAAVFFIVFWGLNVVDAAVDAHLKAFDISPDLSLRVRPNYNPIAKTGGVSFVFNFKH
jgi:Family of unknown function (DUF5683)